MDILGELFCGSKITSKSVTEFRGEFPKISVAYPLVCLLRSSLRTLIKEWADLIGTCVEPRDFSEGKRRRNAKVEYMYSIDRRIGAIDLVRMPVQAAKEIWPPLCPLPVSVRVTKVANITPAA